MIVSLRKEKPKQNPHIPIIVSGCCQFPWHLTWDDIGYTLRCTKCGKQIDDGVYIIFTDEEGNEL
jgi:hypothetical protein